MEYIFSLIEFLLIFRYIIAFILLAASIWIWRIKKNNRMFIATVCLIAVSIGYGLYLQNFYNDFLHVTKSEKKMVDSLALYIENNHDKFFNKAAQFDVSSNDYIGEYEPEDEYETFEQCSAFSYFWGIQDSKKNIMPLKKMM